MDEATEAVAAMDLAHMRCFLWLVRVGRAKFKGTVRPLAVVMVEVDAKHTFEVASVEDQQPVEALRTDCPDEGDEAGVVAHGDVDLIVPEQLVELRFRLREAVSSLILVGLQLPEVGNRLRPRDYRWRKLSVEVWSEAEYTAAIAMLCEGLSGEAVATIADARSRYDGRLRNPYNETEAGHHSVRSLASWGTVAAYTGFHYSAVERRLVVARPDGRLSASYPWAAGAASGTYGSTRTGGLG